jgi:hypothetical protein
MLQDIAFQCKEDPPEISSFIFININLTLSDMLRDALVHGLSDANADLEPLTTSPSILVAYCASIYPNYLVHILFSRKAAGGLRG